MKKGTTQLLVTIIYTVIFLIVVFLALKSFLGPLFPKNKGVSLDNFDMLNGKIADMFAEKGDVHIDDLLFQITKGYFVVGFDYDETTKTFFTNNEKLTKPTECENEACICLYLFEDNELAKCTKAGLKTRIYGSFTGTAIVKPEGQIKLTNDQFIRIKKETRKMDPKDDVLPVTHLLIEGSQATGSGKIVEFGIRKITLYLLKNQNGEDRLFISDGTNNIFRLLYKLENNCWLVSPINKECKDKPFDSVIREEVNGQIKVFSCKYNEEKMECTKKEIKECTSEFIKEECACEDYSYDFGLCLNDEFKNIYYVNKDYCYRNKILENSECNAYEKNEYSCTLNYCGINKDCFWNEQAGIVTGCNECQTSGKCTDYKVNWVKFIDPCNYDNDNPKEVPDEDECVDCSHKNCKEYMVEENCLKDTCQWKKDNVYCGAKYEYDANLKRTYKGCDDCTNIECTQYKTKEDCLNDPCKEWRIKETGKKCVPTEVDKVIGVGPTAITTKEFIGCMVV